MSTNISGVNNSAYNDMLGLMQKNQPISAVENKDNQPQYRTSEIATVKLEEMDLSQKGRKNYFARISIGGGILLAIIAAATITKGTAGGINRKLKRYSSKLKDKTFDLKSDYKNLSFAQKIKLGFTQGMQKITAFLEASSNVNTFKDGFTVQVFKKLNMMPVLNFINKGFKKVVLQTKNKAYRKADNSAAKLCAYLEKHGLSAESEAIMTDFNKSFSTKKHYDRADKMWDGFENLYNDVWANNIHIFGKNSIFNKANRGQLKTYITMDKSAPARNAEINPLRVSKTLLSNSIKDNYKVLKRITSEFKPHINISDKNAMKLMRSLDSQLELYKSLKGDKVLKAAEKLKQTLKELEPYIKSNDKVRLKEQIANFNTILDPELTQKGVVQNALTNFKKRTGLGSDSPEYKMLKKYANEFNKNLNTAVSSEATSYEKFAELQMGAAMTDVFGILFPVALGTGLVLKAKDRDQRITNTLTKGIPIVGGVATSLYGTARMYTGPKNIVFGLVSGGILSVLGAQVDNIYKAYSKKQNAFMLEFETLKKAQNKIKEVINPEAAKEK